MTSPIGPIAPIAGPIDVTSIAGPTGVTPIDTNIVDPQAVTAAGGDFASKLADGLEWVQSLQKTTDDLRVQAATGTLTDVHDYMIASAESGLATQLTTAVRNKAVEAFQEIMRMQA
jgi:flagellar hook-basal body complex protein FliE